MSKTHRITLCWYAKTPTGWRYFKSLFETHLDAAQARHGWVKEKGVLCEYPIGKYVLRSHSDGRRIYTPLESGNPRDAVIALQRARRTALATPETRKAVLKVAAAGYIADCKARGAMEAHRDAKVVLGEFLKGCKVTYTRAITRQDVLTYHATLKAKGNSARTISNKHNRLLSFLRYAKGDLSVMPPKPKYTSKEPSLYTLEQTTAILAAADPYMRVVIQLGLKLGLRELEIAHAMWSDIQWNKSVFRVTDKPQWGWTIKDAEERSVPIRIEVMDVLKAWRDLHPKTQLIVGTRNDKPNFHLLRALKRLARRAGLNCGECKPCNAKSEECENWQLHKFRRTWATKLLRNGVDVVTVQKWAGWADTETALRYLRASEAGSKESQSRINAIVW